MTKWQRKVRAHNAATKRRKARAAADFWKKMNPGKRVPGAVRVKRLKGGGVTITPVTRRNVAAGFYDEEGIFHPLRASYDYSGKRAGEGGKKRTTKKRRR